MSSLSNAILSLQEEVNSFNQGTKDQPKDRSAEWFLLRAKVIGLGYLKRLEQLGIDTDPNACERVYRSGAKLFKSVEIPPEEAVLVEKLPAGVELNGQA